MSSELDFDLAAAGLRADGEDVRISLEVLASKLEASLPGNAEIRRRGGGLLGRGEKHVSEIRVRLGEQRYQLTIDGTRMQGFREREVGGIAIKRESLGPQAWVSALAEDLRAEAQRSADARAALEGLIR